MRHYYVKPQRGRKLVAGLLGFFALFAMYQTATGNGSRTAGGDRGEVRSIFGGESCLRLGQHGFEAAPCTEEDAVPEGDVTDAGDFGGRATGDKLTPERVAELWVAHGGDPAQANVAAAVARAESGLRPGAVNASNANGTIDRGLFQMNSIHGECSTFDLDTNVRCAVALQRDEGWQPWVAYNSGAYRRYL